MGWTCHVFMSCVSPFRWTCAWCPTSTIHIILHSIPLNHPQKAGCNLCRIFVWGIWERGSKFNTKSSLQSLGAVILENTSRYPGQETGIKGLEERDAIRSKDLPVVEFELSHSTDLKLPTP